MKLRGHDSVVIDRFEMISPADLRAHWQATNPELLKLHRCTGLCRLSPQFHSRVCEYMLGLNHHSAISDANSFIARNPGQTYSGTISIAAVAPMLPERSPQAELTLSFLTDAITLKDHGFDNGRHRVAALFDAGVAANIPVLRV